MTVVERIAALRDRLEAISDERHFPAHMMSAHEEMCDVLDEMSRMIPAIRRLSTSTDKGVSNGR